MRKWLKATEEISRVINLILGVIVTVVEFGFITEVKYKIWILYGLLAGLIINILSSRLEKKFGKIQEDRNIINKSLDLACIGMSKGTNSEIRANVFMPTRTLKSYISAETSLRIKFHSTNMERSSDRGLKLKPFQGCAGSAYGIGETTVADLSRPEEIGGPKWGLTEDQKQLTRNLKAILSLPMFHPDNNRKVVAVLNFDSEGPIADHFSTDATQEQAAEMRDVIQLLLLGSQLL